jgi:hypothetical protein
MLSDDDRRKLRAFCYKYTRLIELIDLGGDALIFEGSAILRHFLNEQLTQRLANIFGLHLKFFIPVSYEKNGFHALNPGIIHENNATIELNVAALLDLQIAEANDEGQIRPLSCHAVISAIANAGGGIHDDGHDPSDEKTLKLIQASQEEDLIVTRLSRVVVESLEYLFRCATDDKKDLFQFSKKRQPGLTLDGRLAFLGDTYLEGYIHIDLEKGFTTSFFCLIPPNPPSEKSVLLSIGNRRLSRFFEIWVDIDGRVNLTVQMKKTAPETKKVGNVRFGNCNIVFSCKREKEKIQVTGYSRSRLRIREFSFSADSDQISNVIGKSVLGADLTGKNGSLLQNPELLHFDRPLQREEAVLVLENAATQHKTWEAMDGPVLCRVVQLYGQT